MCHSTASTLTLQQLALQQAIPNGCAAKNLPPSQRQNIALRALAGTRRSCQAFRSSSSPAGHSLLAEPCHAERVTLFDFICAEHQRPRCGGASPARTARHLSAMFTLPVQQVRDLFAVQTLPLDCAKRWFRDAPLRRSLAQRYFPIS